MVTIPDAIFAESFLSFIGLGIQPTVAFAMVRLGMGLDNIHTALDLEEGLEYLQRLLRQGPEQQPQG